MKRFGVDAEVGVRELWCWVNPEATARACFLSIDGNRFKGHEGKLELIPFAVSTSDLLNQPA